MTTLGWERNYSRQWKDHLLVGADGLIQKSACGAGFSLILGDLSERRAELFNLTKEPVGNPCKKCLAYAAKLVSK